MKISPDSARMVRTAARRRLFSAGRRGFTMVELMITMVILGLSSVFIYQIFITQHDSYVAQQDVSETQQDVRASLDMIARDLRSAGYGVPGGGTGITATTNGPSNGPDSIAFQTAQPGATAASAFLTADASSASIDVNSTTGFSTTKKVNLLNLTDRSVIGGALYTINSVSGTTRLTLNATPAAKQGDLVVSADSTTNALDTITYALFPVGDGTYLLQRTSALNGTTETLADHILGLKIQYTLSATGADLDTVDAANWNNIYMVKVTLTTQTLKNIAKAGSGSESGYRLGQRALTSFIRLKNSNSS